MADYSVSLESRLVGKSCPPASVDLIQARSAELLIAVIPEEGDP